MCLVIKSKRLKAETDIMVYKCLDYYAENNTYETPFQYFPVNFNRFGECYLNVLKSEFVQCKEKGTSQRFIERGIHAYFKKTGADDTCACFSETHMHYAVIPMGSYYYIGTHGEVASNSLIVFKNRNHYLNYKKNKGYNIPTLFSLIRANKVEVKD